jgi:hypothetical protein
MKSYPSSEDVFSGLGDKVLDAIAEAVERTKADLRGYRKSLPDVVAQSSERGLASWIHDRNWYNLIALLDGVDDVAIVDREPIREIGVRSIFRLRLKRHHLDGTVSTYPTQGALEFMLQGPRQGVLDGFEEVRLICGYEWRRDSREIGQALISLRDGIDQVVWTESVDQRDMGSGGARLPVRPTPPPPDIDATKFSQGDEKNVTE